MGTEVEDEVGPDMFGAVDIVRLMLRSKIISLRRAFSTSKQPHNTAKSKLIVNQSAFVRHGALLQWFVIRSSRNRMCATSTQQ